MNLKENVKEILAIMFGAAFIAFTAIKLVPPEAFVGVATAAITYYFEEKSKERLIRELNKLKGGD